MSASAGGYRQRASHVDPPEEALMKNGPTITMQLGSLFVVFFVFY